MSMQRPTILDVARVAGTSKSVVSRVITGNGAVGDKTRTRVEEAMQTLGYRANPAGRSLVSGRTGAVGVLLRNTQSGFYANFFTQLQREASSSELSLLGATGNMVDGSERPALESLLDHGVDALVIGSGRLDPATIASVAARVPSVVVSRPAGQARAAAVFDDPAAHADLTLDALWHHGHRSIGLLVDPSYSAVLRVDALRRRANELGMRMATIESGYDLEPGMTAARRWLAGPRGETALLTMAYDAACGVMWELQAAGLAVPGDVSVVAADSYRPANPFLPAVTGSQRDETEFAGTVWREVVARLQAPDAQPTEHRVPVHWVEGATLAAAR
ncbi:MAG: LacI family DNA-binding transcriptional regulator [Arachnia sp.]